MQTAISIFTFFVFVSAMFGARYLIGILAKKIKIGKHKNRKSGSCCEH